MALHLTQNHCRFFVAFPLTVHLRCTHDKQASQLMLDSWLSSMSHWQTLHTYVQFCCLAATILWTHFQASAVKNRLMVARQILSLRQALSTCSGMVSMVSSVNLLPARAAMTWFGDTNHDNILSSFLLGTRFMNATHPNRSFYFGNPTTVFSHPFGLPRFLMWVGNLIDAKRWSGTRLAISVTVGILDVAVGTLAVAGVTVGTLVAGVRTLVVGVTVGTLWDSVTVSGVT